MLNSLDTKNFIDHVTKMDRTEQTVTSSDTATLLESACEPATDQPLDYGSVTFAGLNSQPTVPGKMDPNEGNVPPSVTVTRPKEGVPNKNYFIPEIFLFLLMFGLMSSSVCNKKLSMSKACSNYFLYPAETCDNMTDEVRIQVQQVANNYNLYGQLIQLIPAAMLSMFIGTWSDRYSRKLPLVVATVGIVIGDLLTLLNAVFLSWPLQYMLLSSVPSGLVGSLIAINTCIYSYTSEKTPHDRRTFKYAILELAFVVAMPAGTFVAGQLFDKFGYVPVYLLSMTTRVLAALYVLVAMQEGNNLRGHSFVFLVKEFFSFESVRENLKTSMKKRTNHGRAQIWMLTISMCVILLSYMATAEIMYYFCDRMYGWSLPKYSNVSTITSIIGIAIMVVFVPLLTRVIRLQDALLGLLGTLSILGQGLARAVAFQEWIYFVAIAIGCFGGFAPLAVRSRLSKIVSTDEIGKVFALVSSCESLAPIIGTIIFTQIYNASVASFPGLAFLVGACMMAFPFVSFVIILRWQKPIVPSSEDVTDAINNTTVQS